MEGQQFIPSFRVASILGFLTRDPEDSASALRPCTLQCLRSGGAAATFSTKTQGLKVPHKSLLTPHLRLGLPSPNMSFWGLSCSQGLKTMHVHTHCTRARTHLVGYLVASLGGCTLGMGGGRHFFIRLPLPQPCPSCAQIVGLWPPAAIKEIDL